MNHENKCNVDLDDLIQKAEEGFGEHYKELGYDIHYFLDMAKKMQYNPNGKDIQYPRKRFKPQRASEIVANNPIAQKAISDYLGIPL